MNFFATLREITNPPKKLFLKGRLEILNQPCIAIVGTRHPTPYGLRAAACFSGRLAALGFCIVSGLARGIDAAAHEAALGAKGKTVAVLGNGLDRVYPREHESLAESILSNGGLLVSEYAEGTPPEKYHFPERNRLISGFSWATLVVQATQKSGSLITARHALEQNREVFVVPGLFDDSSFAGSHCLLQAGAKLTTTIEDILDEIPPYIREKLITKGVNQHPMRLYEIFSAHPTGISLDELMGRYPKEFRKILVDLEQALHWGMVAEFSPHHFVWVGTQSRDLETTHSGVTRDKS